MAVLAGGAGATAPPAPDIQVRAKASDTVIILPQTGGVARVEQPAARGNGREVFSCAPQTLGRLLARLDADPTGGANHAWVDLLAAATPGVAVSVKRGQTYILLAFGARQKTVNQHIGANIHPLLYTLPPSVWMQKYNTDGRLVASYLWLTATKVSNANDQVQAIACPFGNVFDPAGNLCWGNVVTTPLRPHDPLACDNLFWGTDFNDHLVRYNWFSRLVAGVPTAFRNFTEWSTYMRTEGAQAPPTLLWAQAHPRPFSEVLRRALGGTED